MPTHEHLVKQMEQMNIYHLFNTAVLQSLGFSVIPQQPSCG